jgi:hypothetical protein
MDIVLDSESLICLQSDQTLVNVWLCKAQRNIRKMALKPQHTRIKLGIVKLSFSLCRNNPTRAQADSCMRFLDATKLDTHPRYDSPERVISS